MKKTRVITLGALAATLALGTSPAWGAELTETITSVTSSTNQVAVGDPFTLTAQWKVPDNSQPGDTFTLELSAQLRALSRDFDVRDDAGNVIATAHASDGTVTVTLGQYVATHPRNIQGNLYFVAEVREGTNTSTPITVDWGGTATTTITPVVDGVSTPVTQPVKYGWMADDGKVGWAIDIPGDNNDVQIQDDPTDNTVDCSSIRFYEGDSTDGYPKSWTLLPLDTYTCTSSGITIDISSVPANETLHIIYYTTPNAGVTTVHNGWTVKASKESGSGLVQQEVYNAGGSGSADAPEAVTTPTPTPSASTTPPPSTTPSPSTTATPSPSATTATPSPSTTSSTAAPAATAAHAAAAVPTWNSGSTTSSTQGSGVLGASSTGGTATQSTP